MVHRNSVMGHPCIIRPQDHHSHGNMVGPDTFHYDLMFKFMSVMEDVPRLSEAEKM
jgi:hypothetical protein